MIVAPMIDIELAKEKARTGDCEGAIEMARAIVEDEFATGEMIFRGTAVATLVESLLQRGTDTDVQEAQTAIERLAAVPTEPGFVLYSVALLRLRALLARTLATICVPRLRRTLPSEGGITRLRRAYRMG